MISFALGMSLLRRGARWGDLEVLDLDDIEAQLAKNPKPVIVSRSVSKCNSVSNSVTNPVTKSIETVPHLVDLEAGWSLVERKKKTKTPSSVKAERKRKN